MKNDRNDDLNDFVTEEQISCTCLSLAWVKHQIKELQTYQMIANNKLMNCKNILVMMVISIILSLH